MMISATILQVDELIESIVAQSETMTAYYADIDAMIVATCLEEGVKQADIPLDGSGYVESLHLQQFAKFYGMRRILMGYAGVGGMVNDVYRAKVGEYDMEMKTWRGKINKTIITGGDATATLPKSTFIKSFAIAL